MSALFFAVIIVLITSAICSGTEAALFSVPVIKVRQLAENKKKSSLALLKIRENIQRPIATIVILNNVANIVGSITVGSIATEVLGDAWLGVFSGGLTFLVIVFSEIIPKTIGEQHCISISLFSARTVLFITCLFTPLLWFLEKMTEPLQRDKSGHTTDESQIRFMAKVGRLEGAIEEDESEMIQNIFKLNDVTALDLMTPRVAMTCIEKDKSLAECKNVIIDSPHSRIIVIEETPDQVCGVVFKNELLIAMVNKHYDSKISDFVHEVAFVPDSIKADHLLVHFQENRQHIVVPVDEYSGVSGVVTLEDVLEVLTGEIVDETDQVVNLREFARKKQQKQ